MSPAEVIIVLHRLAELGAVAYEGSGDAPRQQQANGPAPATSSGLHRRVEPVITDTPIAEPSAEDAAELSEAIDIALDRKKLILTTFQVSRSWITTVS